MKFSTGQTIYDSIISVDVYNNPISSATFSISVFKNAATYTAVTVNMTLIDASNGIFSSSWSADTIGDYQILYKNNNTNVLYISNPSYIRSDDEISTNVYVGL